MFHIKICGITTVEDGLMTVEAGADAIGLNFFARSPRWIDAAAARQIAQALPSQVTKVGLFVNMSRAQVCQIFDEVGLDVVQLHGDEPPEFLVEMGGRPVLRAFRLGADGLIPVAEYLARCRALNAMPQWVLLDTHVPGAYGGTGRTADWTLAAHYAQEVDMPPLVLAGGLTPKNVAEAIRAVHPFAVDTASGVESSPGHKDPALVAAFVRAAQAAAGAS